MGNVSRALSLHRLMRRLQAAYRRKHGKEPTQLPGEGPGSTEGDLSMKWFMDLFVGQNSQKAPMAAGLTALIGLAGLMGVTVPGLPALTQDASLQMVAGGLIALFMAFRVKKSGPTL